LIFLAALPLLLLCSCSPDAGLDEAEILPLNGDVIVLGGGIAGLTTALEAARHGASVILCFRERPDERWMWRDGILGTGEEGNAAALEGALRHYGGSEGKEWHYRLLARRADESLAWLSRETGLKVIPAGGFLYLPENLSCDQAWERLYNKALDEGVRILEGVQVEELLFGKAGQAAGIKLADSHGLKHTAYAPAVVLADGGYLGDGERMEKLAPGRPVASWRGRGEGDSVRLARAAGLDLVQENLFSYTLAVEEGQKWVEADPPPGTLLIVDKEIYSFLPQAEAELASAVLQSEAGTGYLLVAEANLEAGAEPNWPRYPGLGAFLEAYGIDLPQLYRRFSRPQGYFYGCPVKAAAAYCLGGIAVNEAGNVLRADEPVPGLYAVGESAGGLHGAALMPGAALTEALAWGRRIGEAASRYAQG
jgi:succinate dehydrogenase/fumarate reductase flavoprotein subunit